MNAIEPMNATLRLRSASMSQEATAALVYPASTVLLAADLAAVTTDIIMCLLVSYVYYSKDNGADTLFTSLCT